MVLYIVTVFRTDGSIEAITSTRLIEAKKHYNEAITKQSERTKYAYLSKSIASFPYRS